jgi:exonuclease III
MDDIDPDKNYLNEVGGRLITKCKYHYMDSSHQLIAKKLENSKIALMHLNIRSIPKNLNTLVPLLDTSIIEYNFLAFTETWLQDSNADAYGIKGFNHEFLTRSNRKGEGVSIFVKENLSYKPRPNLSIMTNTTEMLWIEVDGSSLNSKTNYLLGVIYRIPGTDPTDFNNILSDTLNKIDQEKKNCIHIGDYNINLINSDTHLPSNQFININFSHSLLPTINRPTRITSSTASLIDNIFTNFHDSSNSYSGIIMTDLSDHFPVFFIQFTEDLIKPETFITYRSNTDDNKILFKTKLQDIDWKPILDDSDTQSSYSKFHEILSKTENDSFPIKRIKAGYSTKLKWLTMGIKKSISHKHKLHILYLKTPSPDNLANYKKFKNKLRHILKTAERNFYQSELRKNQNNMRKSWALIKDIINKNRKKPQQIPKLTINGKSCEDSQEISNAFCKFFTNIGPILDSKIPTSNINPLSYISKYFTINIFLQPVTDHEI